MKSILSILCLAAICWVTGIHGNLLSFIGVGNARFGITESDPLGSPRKIFELWSKTGFNAEFGAVNTARTISFTSEFDQKRFPDFSNLINLTVGDEEYIQEISGVFVGSQHGMSPQRPTTVEQEMVALWKSAGGGKPKFAKIDDGHWKVGTMINLPQSHMEATFENDRVKGKWLYAETSPLEVIQLEVK